MLKVVKFYSTGCGPCKMLQPTLEDLKKKYGFILEEVCVDEGIPEEYSSYTITSVPTLIFKKDDVVKETLAGFKPNRISEILDVLEK